MEAEEEEEVENEVLEGVRTQSGAHQAEHTLCVVVCSVVRVDV